MLLAVALSASLLAGLPGRAPAAAAAPPNIVLVVTDDQHLGTLRWMPAVRRHLVEKGTRFDNAIVPTPTCCPARASLLTGLLAQRTGVWRNRNVAGEPMHGGWRAFAANRMEHRTIATALTPTHRTILVGKYLNLYSEAAPGYVPPGWDRWHAFNGTNGRYYDYDLVHTDGSTTHHGSEEHDYATDVLASLAVGSIERTPRGRPIFLYFAPNAPHGPTLPARRHRSLGRDLPRYEPPSIDEDPSDKPPWLRALPDVRRGAIATRRAAEYATLRAVDEAVAAIVRALRRAGRLDDTLLIFTSDNGVSWGEHRIPVANKYLPYDAQSRVPLVMRWDGFVRAGRASERLVANVDITATIAHAAGLALRDIDGRSLFDRRRHGVVLSAAGTRRHDGSGLSFARPAYCGYRTARYLYVAYATGAEELYDYRNDPHELRNIAHRKRARAIRERLWRRTTNTCVPAPPGF